jgi:transcriptional regulator with XRE-family HTH domain
VITEPEETAKRVKAARAYAGLTREELAQLGPLTYKQLKLLEDGRRKITSREELLEIGRICGVPSEFMEIGFQGAQDVYKDLQQVFAVVLSRDMPAILAEAKRLGVLQRLPRNHEEESHLLSARSASSQGDSDRALRQLPAAEADETAAPAAER